jgi:hypothetical protein
VSNQQSDNKVNQSVGHYDHPARAFDMAAQHWISQCPDPYSIVIGTRLDQDFTTQFCR